MRETKIVMLRPEWHQEDRANRFSSMARPRQKKADEDIVARAYAWAVSAQEKYGFIATPIELDGFENGDKLTYNPAEVYVSVFYDEKTDTAILRRDWDGGYLVQYNVLVNYADLKKIAPHSIKQLLENGVKLYKRLGG